MVSVFLISVFVIASATIILGLVGPPWTRELRVTFLTIGSTIFGVYTLGAIWVAVEWIRDKNRSGRDGSGNRKS